jgi:hypothetical protein
MAGVASMATAIITAETSLRLVIQFLHIDTKSQSCWLLQGSGEVIDRLKEQFLTSLQRSARRAFQVMRSRTTAIGEESNVRRAPSRAALEANVEIRTLDTAGILGQV